MTQKILLIVDVPKITPNVPAPLHLLLVELRSKIIYLKLTSAIYINKKLLNANFIDGAGIEPTSFMIIKTTHRKTIDSETCTRTFLYRREVFETTRPTYSAHI